MGLFVFVLSLVGYQNKESLVDGVSVGFSILFVRQNGCWCPCDSLYFIYNPIIRFFPFLLALLLLNRLTAHNGPQLYLFYLIK